MSQKSKGQGDKNKSKRVLHLGLHHIVPSSRGRNNSYKNMYPRERWGEDYSEKHRALHLLFVNRTPKEIVELIKDYAKNNGSLKKRFFSDTFYAIVDVVEDGVRYVKPRKDNYRRENRHPNLDKVYKRRIAWECLFPNMNTHEAIEWIEREFIKKTWLEASQ